MTAVLLSLKPTFAARLLSGDKTAEVRRRFPILAAGAVVYVYASSPVCAVLGTLEIDGVHAEHPDRLWERFGTRLDITRDYFDAYLDGRTTGVVLELRPLSTWPAPVPLDDLRSHVQVEPPQSFRYLTPDHTRLLEAVTRRS